MAKTNQLLIGTDLPLELREPLRGWRSGDGPLFRRLAASLASAVDRGELLPGMRLPPERALAAQLRIGRGTVAAAYQLLRKRGVVDRRQGRGTEIAGRDATLLGGRAAELATSLQRNLLFRNLGEPSTKMVDLLGSCASPSPPIREAIAGALAGLRIDELARGNGYFPLGYPPLRQAVAEHLTDLGLPSSEDELLITGGAQQAISLVATCYLERGHLVVVEDPTFPGAIDAFRAAGARILTVRVGEGGTDVELLRATLAQSSVRALYLMPTFHNPTGVSMSDDARRELARLSRAVDVPIIEDNTVAELAFDHEPPPPLGAFSRDAPVISIGSLSKLFWGGLRVGWIRASRPAIAQLGRVKAIADLGTSLLSQAVAVQLLADVEHLKQIRCRELAERLDLLSELLEQRLPGWQWRRPAGGLSLWARLAGGSATELAYGARRHGVLIVPGSAMSATGICDEFVRLPFDHEEAVIREGVRRLGKAWKEYRAATGGQDPQRLDIVV